MQIPALTEPIMMLLHYWHPRLIFPYQQKWIGSLHPLPPIPLLPYFVSKSDPSTFNFEPIILWRRPPDQVYNWLAVISTLGIQELQRKLLCSFALPYAPHFEFSTESTRWCGNIFWYSDIGHFQTTNPTNHVNSNS